MSVVQYLAGLQRPGMGITTSEARLILRQHTAYVSNGTNTVHSYDTRNRRITASILFPAKVLLMEWVPSMQQLYVLCAKSGIYVLDLDEEGRCLKEPDSTKSIGGVSIISISSESCCVCDPSVCSFTATCEVLVTASKHPNDWGIKLYHRKSMNGQPAATAPFREVQFSMKLRPGAAQELDESIFHPVLHCVTPWNGMESSDPCGFQLERALFTSAFGLDCSLLDSPVILGGFPDGQVVCFPLNPAGLPRPTNSGQHLEQVKLLYHLEQPVVYICATRLEVMAGEGAGGLASDCLMFLGHKGLLVRLMHLGDTQGVTRDFREFHVQAPVSCAVCSGSCIYYSTRSDLLSITVPLTPKEGNSRASQNPILPSASHSITYIAAMAVTSRSAEGDVELLALSSRGKLMLCQLSQGRGGARAGLSGVKSGKRIKALLSGIGTISERVSKLRSLLAQKTNSLMTLNQVASLSRVVLCAPLSECLVHCQIKVSWTHVLQKSCFVAACTLKNNTDCVLEKGWTLCIYLGTECSDVSASYTFPLPRLLPGHQTELYFPLPTQQSDSLDFPLKISCTLFYSFKEFAVDYGSSINPTDSFSPFRHGICLPLQEHIIDILHCFRLNPRDGHLVTSAATHWDVLEACLKISAGGYRCIREIRNLPEDFNRRRLNFTAPLKVTVRISSLLFNKVLQTKKTGVSRAVIHWLFPGEQAENKEEVQGLTPHGREICLRVQELSVEDATNFPTTEIEISSPHLDALAYMHMAVTSRIKTLVQQYKGDGCNPPMLKLRNVQEQFIARESFLKEIQAQRDKLCVLKGLNSDQVRQRLLSIYRELRQPGLLIF
uniref:FA core complex associated protein 100 n=1 Tax=Leptobrachium leishanense TaxID=445787 RepID=A0A8C5WM90_9ANUR